MSLTNGMLLYHGSYVQVDAIDLGQCYEGKDFGRGFYLTSDASQAKRFISTSLKKAKDIGEAPGGQSFGFVSSFEYVAPPVPLAIYEFSEADAEWLWFVSVNRRASLAAAFEGKRLPYALAADIVIGKVANDATNPVIATYLNGLYGPVDSERAVRTAVENLLPSRLKDQFCFKTDAAISCLEFKGATRYDV